MEKNFLINGQTLTVEIADSFIGRFLGLMGRRRLENNHALLLNPCSSVHMMFMRFSIDVVYLDKEFTIKKIVSNLRPWIGLSMCFGAESALEMPAGEAERLNLKVGQKFNET